MIGGQQCGSRIKGNQGDGRQGMGLGSGSQGCWMVHWWVILLQFHKQQTRFTDIVDINAVVMYVMVA